MGRRNLRVALEPVFKTRHRLAARRPPVLRLKMIHDAQKEIDGLFERMKGGLERALCPSCRGA
jgi:hypothetical protein